MRTDTQVQRDVMNQLKWEPLLRAGEIGVAVKNGIVTLSGIVDTYLQKVTAETSASKVMGVKAVACDLQVGVSPTFKRTDAEIAEAVLNAFEWNTAVPEDLIAVRVDDGHVILEGEVAWDYQRKAAEKSLENLAGIRKISNRLTIRPALSSQDISRRISEALLRSATIDSQNIIIAIKGPKVILSGTVRSLAEKETAEAAVWSAPGITSVENNIQVKEMEHALL